MGRQTKHGFSTDDYETPGYVIDYVIRHWGPPDLDLCATQGTTKAPRYFGPDRGEPAIQDGLRAIWGQSPVRVVWCNPPYSNPAPWVDLVADNRHWYRWGIMLLPSTVEVAWWRKGVHENAQDVIHIHPRVAFLNPLTHKPLKGPRGPVSLVVFDGLAPDAPIRYRYEELRP